MRKIFFVALLLAIGLLPAWAQAQNSRVGASYLKRANQRFAKGDDEGAIADFGVAIMADPQFAMAPTITAESLESVVVITRAR